MNTKQYVSSFSGQSFASRQIGATRYEVIDYPQTYTLIYEEFSHSGSANLIGCTGTSTDP